jgi:hypothetical protein
MGEMKNSYKILIGKSEEMRTRGKPTCKREDNIRMDLREIGWEGLDGFISLKIWTNGGLLCNEPSGSKKGGEFLD